MSVKPSESNIFLAFRVSPVVLVRVSSILLVGLMLGQMSAYTWASAHDRQETQLVGEMKTVDFVFMGERQTYWGLYFGWALLVGVLLVTLAITLWILANVARVAQPGVGAITAGAPLALRPSGARSSHCT